MKKNVLFYLFIMMCMKISAQEASFCPSEFKVDIRGMVPLKYAYRPVSYGYSLEVRNDSAIVDLPYIGEVHNPSYNGDGLNFRTKYKKIEYKSNKKGTATIVFLNVSHGIINYRIKVTAHNNGTADIHVTPSNAQSCSYSGWWKE